MGRLQAAFFSPAKQAAAKGTSISGQKVLAVVFATLSRLVVRGQLGRVSSRDHRGSSKGPPSRAIQYETRRTIEIATGLLSQCQSRVREPPSIKTRRAHGANWLLPRKRHYLISPARSTRRLGPPPLSTAKHPDKGEPPNIEPLRATHEGDPRPSFLISQRRRPSIEETP